jgi:flagellar protein FlaI
VIEIRVFSKIPWNFVRLVKKGTVNPDVLAFLWLAMQNKLNILVSGETGCGKTSFINSLALFLPKNDHIISVEDTREIQLPESFKNWSHLTTRNGTLENQVTMDDLLLNCLRMNPSFIILGEVRSRRDIQALARATAMGHPVLSTIHTRDCGTTIKRLEDAGIPPNDMVSIHLNVVLEAVRSRDDPRKTARRVKEIGEYILSGEHPEANRIFRLDMASDTINQVNEPRLFYSRIADKTGMRKEDVKKDMSEKAEVIGWLVGQDVEDIDLLANIIQLYYHDPATMLKAARVDLDMKEVLDDRICHKSTVPDAC